MALTMAPGAPISRALVHIVCNVSIDPWPIPSLPRKPPARACAAPPSINRGARASVRPVRKVEEAIAAGDAARARRDGGSRAGDHPRRAKRHRSPQCGAAAKCRDLPSASPSSTKNKFAKIFLIASPLGEFRNMRAWQIVNCHQSVAELSRRFVKFRKVLRGAVFAPAARGFLFAPTPRSEGLP